RPSELPGKRGFDTAHKALSSRVEGLVRDYMMLTPDEIGMFDVVLYLGVLYHMRNPLDALTQVASLTGTVAIIETAAVVVPGYEHNSIREFFESTELGDDMSNWWVPNERAPLSMCRAAGFRRVDTIVGPRWRSVPTRLRAARDYFLSEIPLKRKLRMRPSLQ